jgi:hypothetical protein
MKNLLIISIIVIAFFSACNKEKKETKEKPCPVVATNLVPQTVKDSFVHRYPTDSVRTWFNKDSIGYCAFFVSSGIEKLAQFNNSGNFIKEEMESNENKDHEDSTSADKTPAGCECEIHTNND